MEKKSSNSNLNKANKAKNDEFYTQLSDISNELKYYKAQLHGKTILCNCDDPFESNFFKYFAANFNALGLKKLIATSYVKSPIVGKQLPLFEIEGLKPDSKEPYVVEINEVLDLNEDGAIGLDDVEFLLKHDKNVSRRLKGDDKYSAGDFRSAECVELLKQADIVITNPPFSLFREFVAQLATCKKQFLIIGNQNAITYKEIFTLIKANKMWLGQSMNGSNRWFRVPKNYEFSGNAKHKVDEDGNHLIFVNSVVWFTNLDVPKRHDTIPLYKHYDPVEYPKYDNYDAIEVSKVAEAPMDYDGTMGVPISFLHKYNPKQFEIVGMCENYDLYSLKTRVYTSQECRDAYFSLFGKEGTYDLNAAGVIKGRKVYQRLLIKQKN